LNSSECAAVPRHAFKVKQRIHLLFCFSGKINCSHLQSKMCVSNLNEIFAIPSPFSHDLNYIMSNLTLGIISDSNLVSVSKLQDRRSELSSFHLTVPGIIRLHFFIFQIRIIEGTGSPAAPDRIQLFIFLPVSANSCWLHNVVGLF